VDSSAETAHTWASFSVRQPKMTSGQKEYVGIQTRPQQKPGIPREFQEQEVDLPRLDFECSDLDGDQSGRSPPLQSSSLQKSSQRSSRNEASSVPAQEPSNEQRKNLDLPSVPNSASPSPGSTKGTVSGVKPGQKNSTDSMKTVSVDGKCKLPEIPSALHLPVEKAKSRPQSRAKAKANPSPSSPNSPRPVKQAAVRALKGNQALEGVVVGQSKGQATERRTPKNLVLGIVPTKN